MGLTRLTFDHFTAFRSLDISLSPGINAFIGTNGTGKTHLMKVAYLAAEITKTKPEISSRLISLFLPYERRIGRLVHRQKGSTRGAFEIFRGDQRLRISFSNHAKTEVHGVGVKDWISGDAIESAYIPVKEMLAQAPGFRSLYAAREIHFESIYADIVDRAFLPVLRGRVGPDRKKLLTSLTEAMDGKVIVKNETFFLKNKRGELEFSLLAEGSRKLALLWLLLQNGTLIDGSILFWDEPEANLNPKILGSLVQILLDLERLGVQIFLATHNYVLLEELNLRAREENELCYFSLHRRNGEIDCAHADRLQDLAPNAIADTFVSLYDREIRRSAGL